MKFLKKKSVKWKEEEVTWSGENEWLHLEIKWRWVVSYWKWGIISSNKNQNLWSKLSPKPSSLIYNNWLDLAFMICFLGNEMGETLMLRLIELGLYLHLHSMKMKSEPWIVAPYEWFPQSRRFIFRTLEIMFGSYYFVVAFKFMLFPCIGHSHLIHSIGLRTPNSDWKSLSSRIFRWRRLKAKSRKSYVCSISSRKL